MIKLISAKDAKEATVKARAKLSISQHEFAYKKIQEASEKGRGAIILNYHDVEFIFEVLRHELIHLGYIVERKQPISSNFNVSLPQEVHISW